MKTKCEEMLHGDYNSNAHLCTVNQEKGAILVEYQNPLMGNKDSGTINNQKN